MNLIREKLFKSQLEVHVKLLTMEHFKNHMPRLGLKLNFPDNISECRTNLLTIRLHLIITTKIPTE